MSYSIKDVDIFKAREVEGKWDISSLNLPLHTKEEEDFEIIFSI
jgi:hypothetical protein